MWKTRVCEILGIQYPILEGGMSIPGNGELAAAVSNAGAFGVVGFNPGWAPPEQQLDNLRDHIRKAKELTDKPFGVNIPLFAGQEMGRVQNSIEVALQEGVQVITTSGGNPGLFTKHIKNAGVKVLHVALNVRQAVKAQEASVDIVIASGYEAGGLLGPDEIPTLPLIPLVVDAVSVPVVAAGGIADGRGFLAAMALGAEGIQMGTRFLATKECHVCNELKEALIRAVDTDTVVTRRNTPPRVRTLRTPWVCKIEDMEKQGTPKEEIARFIGIGRGREALMLGEIEQGDPSMGVVSAMIKEIQPAADIIKSIISQAEETIYRCNELYKR